MATTVREVLDTAVSQLRMDLKITRNARAAKKKVSDDKAKYALQLFCDGSLFTASSFMGVIPVR